MSNRTHNAYWLLWSVFLSIVALLAIAKQSWWTIPMALAAATCIGCTYEQWKKT